MPSAFDYRAFHANDESARVQCINALKDPSEWDAVWENLAGVSHMNDVLWRHVRPLAEPLVMESFCTWLTRRMVWVDVPYIHQEQIIFFLDTNHQLSYGASVHLARTALATRPLAERNSYARTILLGILYGWSLNLGSAEADKNEALALLHMVIASSSHEELLHMDWKPRHVLAMLGRIDSSRQDLWDIYETLGVDVKIMGAGIASILNELVPEKLPTSLELL